MDKKLELGRLFTDVSFYNLHAHAYNEVSKRCKLEDMISRYHFIGIEGPILLEDLPSKELEEILSAQIIKANLMIEKEGFKIRKAPLIKPLSKEEYEKVLSNANKKLMKALGL